MIDNDYRMQILKDALQYRIKEITEYQVNIDNYRIAIDVLKDNDEMKDFRVHLENLLRENIKEQKKAIIIYEVIKKQVEEA